MIIIKVQKLSSVFGSISNFNIILTKQLSV